MVVNRSVGSVIGKEITVGSSENDESLLEQIPVGTLRLRGEVVCVTSLIGLFQDLLVLATGYFGPYLYVYLLELRRWRLAMSTTLTIRDQTTSSFGGEGDGFALDVPTERVTVRELIRTRVYREVHDYNLRRPEYFRGLVQPTDAERTLNGFKVRRGRRIDPEEQFETAIESFYRNGFLILVDDRQVEELEEEIEAGPYTTVTFLKLVPLVGG